MRLATWNVNSIRTRVTRTVEFAVREDIDVLAMQEIKCKPEQFPYGPFEEAGYHVEVHGLNQWNGVAIAALSDHKRDPATMGGVPLEQVLAAPSLKLVIRHPELAPVALFDTLRSLGLTGFEATLSGAPFVEVMAEGVTKATGLARLCAHLGIDRADVVAFGDALNDVEMLRWAGHGVAMGHAAPEVVDAADETGSTNDQDGVAQVIERLLG